MAIVVKCKRYGRGLKNQNQPGYGHGYGPVCWVKEGRFATIAQTIRGEQNRELAELRQELSILKAELRSLKAHGFSNFKTSFTREPFPTNNHKGAVSYLDPQYGKSQEKTLAMAGGSLLIELKDALPTTVS